MDLPVEVVSHARKFVMANKETKYQLVCFVQSGMSLPNIEKDEEVEVEIRFAEHSFKTGKQIDSKENYASWCFFNYNTDEKKVYDDKKVEKTLAPGESTLIDLPY